MSKIYVASIILLACSGVFGDQVGFVTPKNNSVFLTGDVIPVQAYANWNGTCDGGYTLQYTCGSSSRVILNSKSISDIRYLSGSIKGLPSPTTCKISVLCGWGFDEGYPIAVVNIEILQRPYLKLVTPSPNDTVTSGSDYIVTAEQYSAPDTLKLDYSVDNGLTWIVIADSLVGIENTSIFGSGYSWIVPYIHTDTCLLRIGWESFGFYSHTIHVYNPTSLEVFIPYYADPLVAGNVYSIKWISKGDIDSVRLEYKSDRYWRNIVSSTVNDGEYEWTVPNDPSSNVKIRISHIGDRASDESDNVYAIRSPITTAFQLGQQDYTLSVPGGSILFNKSVKEINIFDLRGKLIQKIKISSAHSVWNGSGSKGVQVDQGIFLISFISAEKTSYQKIILSN